MIVVPRNQTSGDSPGRFHPLFRRFGFFTFRGLRFPFFLPLLLLFACSPSFVAPEMTNEERKLLPDCRGWSADRVRAEIERRSGELRDLQGAVLAYMETEERSGTFDGAIALKWPGGMRMKAFRGMGTTFMDLTLVQTGAMLHLPGEGKAYAAGPDDPIPLGEGRQTITTRQLLETLVPSPGPGREFDPRTLFLRRVVIPDTLTAEYRHYRLSDGIWFPRLMEIKDATGSFSLKLLLRDPSINQGLVPGALTLDLPEGVEVVRKNE